MSRPTLLGLSHVAIVVSDLARAEAFYVDLLGLPVVTRHTDDAGSPRSIWVALEGDRFLALEIAGGAPPRAARVDAAAASSRERSRHSGKIAGEGTPRLDSAPGHHCLALRIGPEDRERWRARLEAASVPIVRETGFTMYVRDPDGALIGLSHYPAPRVSASST